MTTRTGVDEVLERAVASGAVPSVAAIAADRDGIIYEGGVGPRVAGENDAVSVDTHYRIMSMTKIVATTVALQLMEQGKLDLDAPVERYCPEFADLRVLDGFDGNAPQLRAPATRATVKQLVTHTSGLSYWFWNADIVRWESATGIPNVLSGLNEIFRAPLIADPGTRFEYGISIDWLGRVIEAASGVKLDEAIRRGVTEPLGMDQTAFLLNDGQRARSVPVHLPGDDGAWWASDIDLSQQPEYWSGGHGLYSTPRDFLKLQRALLGNGTSPDGTKILEPATVEAVFSNQIGELDFPAEIVTADPIASYTFVVGPGFKWGFGLLLNAQDIPGRRRAGSGAWIGLLNTHFWVDRTTGLTAAIYSQCLPFGPEPALRMYDEFEAALYTSL
ncbi:MAG TPA: serine hydrolase domain-containing protein [Solirubrobacteraceae bacterium]|nr:serine hydrolase domain-containing protein [Solirubrobacteraceae bacterium]